VFRGWGTGLGMPGRIFPEEAPACGGVAGSVQRIVRSVIAVPLGDRAAGMP